MSDSSFSPFPQNAFGGALVVNVFAGLSTLALVSVAIRVIWLVVRQKLWPDSDKSREHVFFNTQIGYYASCLLISNTFIGVAGLIGLRWLLEKGVTEGVLCFTQAFLMQTGTWSTAFFTISIAVHTFKSLVLRKRPSPLIPAITIVVGWISSILLAAVPLMKPKSYNLGSVYGPDNLSCGVRSVYLRTQFFFHLLPIFIASVLSTILYSLIFLVLRGTLNIMGGIKLTLDPDERWTVGTSSERYHRFVARIARSMLWYPVAYIILLVPYSVVRLLSISGFTVPFGVLLFAYLCWFMLGIVNVLLLYNTFRVLGPVFDGSTEKDSSPSFGSSGVFKGLTSSWRRERQAEFKEKVMRPLRRSLTMKSTIEFNPQMMIRSPPPVRQRRRASVESFYNFFPVGRRITSPSELERTLIPPRPPPSQVRLWENQPPSHPIATPRTHPRHIHNPSAGASILPSRDIQTRENPTHNGQFSTSSTGTFGQPRNPGIRESIASTVLSDYGAPNGHVGQTGGGTLPVAPRHTPFLLRKPTLGAPSKPGPPELPHPIDSHSPFTVPMSSLGPTGRQRSVLRNTHKAAGSGSSSKF